MKKPKRVSQMMSALPMIGIDAQRAVLTPRLPQFITPVLEPEINRFGNSDCSVSKRRIEKNFPSATRNEHKEAREKKARALSSSSF
jgi:hypothetical protein